MTAAHCNCCCILVEALVSPDIILRDRPEAVCPGCGARGRLSCIEDDDDCNTISHIELVVPRSEVERLAAEDRRDRRNHREMVQVHAVWMFVTSEWDVLWGARQIARKALPRIREARVRADWHQRLGNRALARSYRQSARDLSRHLRRVFASAPELEREALEHVLAAARQP